MYEYVLSWTGECPQEGDYGSIELQNNIFYSKKDFFKLIKKLIVQAFDEIRKTEEFDYLYADMSCNAEISKKIVDILIRDYQFTYPTRNIVDSIEINVIEFNETYDDLKNAGYSHSSNEKYPTLEYWTWKEIK